MAVFMPGKWIHKAYGSVILGIVIIAFVPAMVAKKEMKGFCEQLPVGASVSAVQSQVAAHDYNFSLLAGDHAVVDDEGYFGPHRCDVRFGDKGLVSSVYFFIE
jgi:hypothetical protein